MGLTEEQSEQLKQWGVDPKTIKTEPIKPLPSYTPLLPIEKRIINPLQIIIGIVIGIVLAFLIISIYPEITTIYNDIINETYLDGASYGMEYAIASITEDAIQCKTIPINYLNNSYTLVATECL